MKTYSVKIQINDNGKELQKVIELKAENTTELSEKFNALKTISKHLKHEDFLDTVELISAKPQLITVIKELIEETEKLNEIQIGLKAPFMIKRVIQALKE